MLADLVGACPLLARHAREGTVAYGINARVCFPNGKAKKLDLAIGVPESPIERPAGMDIGHTDGIARLLVACEAKAVMTEHIKAKPRVYDELSSSHEIVHQGQPDAVATGVCVVNLASEFVSPLRQRSADQLVVTRHAQPWVATSVIDHLRGLPRREGIGQVGFEAFATIVVETDNRARSRLVTDMPAPQPGQADDYQTFISTIARRYSERFSAL